MTAQPASAPTPEIRAQAPAGPRPLPEEMPAPARARAQRVAIIANTAAALVHPIALGAVMMLYANDVLRFNAREISGILAALPLAVLLRLPLLGTIRRFGMVRSANLSDAIVIVLLAANIALPARLTTFPLFMFLVVAVAVSIQMGTGAVQQPLLRNITSTRDRGRFFARLRLCWMGCNALVLAALPLVVGRDITEPQFKVLLGLCALGLVNRIFWMRSLPEPPRLEDEAERRGLADSLGRLWRTLRTSKLLRRPLAITLLLSLVAVPIYAVYLKKLLCVPSGMVAVFTGSAMAGSALSMLVWGRLADAIGFRPMLGGLLIANMLLAPLQLFLAPFPAGAEFSWHALRLDQAVTLLALVLIGFFGGALTAGMGIAGTSIEHYHVGNRDALEALNISAVAVSTAAAGAALFHGFLLDRVAVPRGSMELLNGVLHLDWIKGFVIFVGVPLQLAALWLLGRLPNTRPHFGVGDFFSSLTGSLVRSSLALRLVHHDEEARRSEAARWFGDDANPMNLDPLFRLLADPSYDVKVATIRSLARTGSPLAGERLLAVLENPEKKHLDDHVAWALGELRHAPAVDALIRCLRTDSSVRTRAMAARALGKIGEARAVGPLAETLRDAPDGHLVASVSRALIRLGAIECSEPIFDAFAALTDRDERFELADALCDTLEISKRWLLISEYDTLYDSLLAYVDSRPLGWAGEAGRGEAVAALRARDFGGIAGLLGAALARPPWVGNLRLESLHRALGRTSRWQALTVMATAWLLLRRE